MLSTLDLIRELQRLDNQRKILDVSDLFDHQEKKLLNDVYDQVAKIYKIALFRKKNLELNKIEVCDAQLVK